MALGRVKRWVFEPVWTAAPEPKREEWTCPSCGRTVWRTNPAWKGIWFAPVESELVTRCARQHGAHDRHGRPFPEDDDLRWSPVVGLDELAALDDPAARQVPVVGLDDGGFVALLPPAGLRFVKVDGGFEVEVLDELQPSDLVGHAPRRGRIVGWVPDGALDFDARVLRKAISPRAA